MLQKPKDIYHASIPTSMALQHWDILNLDRNLTKIQGTDFCCSSYFTCRIWYYVYADMQFHTTMAERVCLFSIIAQKWGTYLGLIIFQFLS